MLEWNFLSLQTGVDRGNFSNQETFWKHEIKKNCDHEVEPHSHLQIVHRFTMVLLKKSLLLHSSYDISLMEIK